MVKMWNKIMNPKTGRMVKVNGAVGRKILSQYLKVLKGGSWHSMSGGTGSTDVIGIPEELLLKYNTATGYKYQPSMNNKATPELNILETKDPNFNKNYYKIPIGDSATTTIQNTIQAGRYIERFTEERPTMIFSLGNLTKTTWSAYIDNIKRIFRR